MGGEERKFPIILASRSPRRQELLRQVGIRVEIIPSMVEERPLEGESPDEHVIRLAQEKAMEVAARYPGRWVIGADTIVLIDGEVLGKPRNRKEAVSMLQRLSGKEHRVYTGICLVGPDGEIKEIQSVMTRVIMKELSQKEIEGYVRTGEPFDKAGGYAIQGMGSAFIKEIHGSYSNVVGLPLCEVIDILKRICGIVPFERYI
jgi:septum formation protein